MIASVSLAGVACDKKGAAPDAAPPAPAADVAKGDAAQADAPKVEADAKPVEGDTAKAPEAAKAPTAEDAKAFIDEANQTLHKLRARAETAEYIKATYITPDTERNAAAAQADVMAYLAVAIPKAASFRDVEVPAETRRMLELLRISPTLPPPPEAKLQEELTTISARLEGHYGSAKGCHVGADGKEVCKDLGELSETLATSTNWDELASAWKDWHDTAKTSRADFKRLVELGNIGAKSLGFGDVGELWRSGYDMSPADFETEIERLWQQVRPLYEKLHCLARGRLAKKWGADKVDVKGPIPTQLLGNMWGQDWSTLYPIMAPYPEADAKAGANVDLSAALKDKGVDAKKLMQYGEGFFTSIGLPALPESFWANTMLTKPKDREVVCHASAWDVTYAGDVRIKMCIKVDEEDFITVHHELGHIYYFMLYKDLPILFQNGANDGFHEAIGDAVALSVTPKYLVDVGLFKATEGGEGAEAEHAVLNEQMRRALDKISFLPFGRLIDQWRWDVFAGKVPYEQWNSHWWALKAKYQGVAPPVARGDDEFDPGAKYHVPASTPYMRYFLASILQFQFHRALCKVSGHTGPLHTCSIYGNKEAGKRLGELLALGASKPWQEALFALSGERQMDASAILDYFAPLTTWIDAQIKTEGLTCGW
ncbi:MAG: M2 family metallopeptidase [Deltaproteobacteria bacterium]|nr:M2 family metallopeptidase [Deltaproteobacteria bacterium]